MDSPQPPTTTEFKQHPAKMRAVPQPRCKGLAVTRREFVQGAGGMAFALGTLSRLPDSLLYAFQGDDDSGNLAAGTKSTNRDRYRAISWWLTWDDLTWPNEELKDKIRRRAERCAATGVNCCIIFGAHFRWDFMPLWGRLHDLLRFIRDELHSRHIALWDHHSSVLVHRPRNADEALAIWQKNRHHVPFYPSCEAAAEWHFNGSRLNDWRMIDVETGQPCHLPAYHAEQFCMNNPAFQEAYTSYLKLLIEQAGVDGLMSDDGIFYAGWHACRCQFCVARFQRDYGHALPSISDTNFWGNRHSQAFRDWVAMRFRSSGDFLVVVRQSLPKDFPLLTCCSSSDDQTMPALGMTYEEFTRACNVVMLEMVGSTPGIRGGWDNRIASQLLHLAIARDANRPCLGLGYGFFPDTAFFIWALNKFLGADCWFSTLKGRLGVTAETLAGLADDSELVAEGFRWESARPELFAGEVESDTGIFFSRSTRDSYGQVRGDYVADYQASCLALVQAGVGFEVFTKIPSFGRTRTILLSSTLCLADQERIALNQFLVAGGTVIATGPIGFYDQSANAVSIPWLQEHGLRSDLTEPQRESGFPPYENLDPLGPVAQCGAVAGVPLSNDGNWCKIVVGKGQLLWRHERFASKGIAAAVVRLLASCSSPTITARGLPDSWRTRQYRDGNRLLVHALPAQVITKLHASLTNQISGERIIEGLTYAPLTTPVTISAPTTDLRRVSLHSPDLQSPRTGSKTSDRGWSIDASGVRRYLILECELG